MARLDRDAKRLIRGSKEYAILTENGMSVRMTTGRILAGVTSLLQSLKEKNQ